LRNEAGFTEQLPSVSQTISATHDCDADSNQAMFSNTPSNCFNSTEDFPDDIDIIFGSKYTFWKSVLG